MFNAYSRAVTPTLIASSTITQYLPILGPKQSGTLALASQPLFCVAISTISKPTLTPPDLTSGQNIPPIENLLFRRFKDLIKTVVLPTPALPVIKTLMDVLNPLKLY